MESGAPDTAAHTDILRLRHTDDVNLSHGLPAIACREGIDHALVDHALDERQDIVVLGKLRIHLERLQCEYLRPL